MNAWLIATIALLPPIAAAAGVGWRGSLAERFVAVEFASSLTALALVTMSFAFEQPSLIDLPLAIALLSLPGMLVVAHVVERWL